MRFQGLRLVTNPQGHCPRPAVEGSAPGFWRASTAAFRSEIVNGSSGCDPIESKPLQPKRKSMLHLRSLSNELGRAQFGVL